MFTAYWIEADTTKRIVRVAPFPAKPVAVLELTAEEKALPRDQRKDLLDSGLNDAIAQLKTNGALTADARLIRR